MYQALGKTGKAGGQEGDPLEMIIFCLSIHHLWGRTKHVYAQARAIAYADDGHINAPLSVALRILADLTQVFKEVAGLELNMLKTQILAKDVSTDAAFAATKGFLESGTALSTPPPSDMCV